MSNTTYDILAQIGRLWLIPVAGLIATLGQIWGIEVAVPVAASLLAVAECINAILAKKSKEYFESTEMTENEAYDLMIEYPELMEEE